MLAGSVQVSTGTKTSLSFQGDADTSAMFDHDPQFIGNMKPQSRWLQRARMQACYVAASSPSGCVVRWIIHAHAAGP